MIKNPTPQRGGGGEVENGVVEYWEEGEKREGRPERGGETAGSTVVWWKDWGGGSAGW